MQIIPIASGKGGVGKSILATNLSCALAQAGKKVVCADLDLGGSNLHVMFGLQGIKSGIGTFVKGFRDSIEELPRRALHPRRRGDTGARQPFGTAEEKAFDKPQDHPL
jgi:flagellar biosynthesis protein FlhG